MSKINLMATGAFYACGRDEIQCRNYLEHLENDKPTLALVMEDSPEYGIIIDVMEDSRKMASIGRLDIGTALSAMRLANEEFLTADVESVCYEGRYFTLRIDVENELEDSIYAACDWSLWKPLDLPLLSPSERVKSVCTAIRAMNTLMKKGRKENAGMTLAYLKTLTENCRCDVSRETQDCLRLSRGYLEQCQNEQLRGYAREIVHATNGLGSLKRIAEYNDYWTALVDSDEALQMVNQWWMLQDSDNSDAQTVENIRCQKRALEQNLKQLPDHLYFSINDPAQLLHLLVYKYIPREKLRALMSELVLLDRLEALLPAPSPKGEGVKTPERENTAAEELSEEQKIARAIDSTHAKMRLQKKEFRIIHKLLKERYDKGLSMQGFEKFIKKYCSFSKDDMPSWNNIKQLPLMANTTYPDWKFYDTTPAKVERYMNVGMTFLEFLA